MEQPTKLRKDISHMLIVPVKTVKSRLYEALKPLRRLLRNDVEVSRRTTARHEAETTRVEASVEFQGENITLKQYEQMSLPEKLQLQEEVEKENSRWVQWTFSILPGATWIMVVDGDVIAHGRPEDFPSDAQFLELIHSKADGHYPFFFENPLENAIEESGASWHRTTLPHDYYPTLLVCVASLQTGAIVEVKSDFDTGTRATFCDLEWLQHGGIAQFLPTDLVRRGYHLGQSYAYTPKRLCVELVDESGVTRSVEREILCVFDWQRSPFVNINPERKALLGRGIPLELKPIIHLDFDQRESKVDA